MKKTILFDEKIFNYELTYKNVKNINLRIKSDGSINVSANPFVSCKVIENFLVSRQDFIVKALEKLQSKPGLIKYYTEDEIRNIITEICRKVYPYYEKFGIKYPEIKFRRMTSCWGNCRSQKSIVTFNTNLMYAPYECIEYVVYHEFTHFLQPNHSDKFYKELSLVCPDWKDKRNCLKSIRF